MRKRKIVTGLSLIMACTLLTAGCGASDFSKVSTTEAAAEAYEYATDDIYLNAGISYEVEEAPVAGEAKTEAGGSESEEVQVKDNSRKLIRNVNLNVETEEFDVLMGTITEKTEKFGGYVESSSTYNGSYYYGNQNRNANLTIRIPAEHLDEFLSAVAENSNVISRDENVTDVTLQYVDMKSHKEALETEQTRLLELLEQAESVEDIITIESRLSDVRYQIESMESQLRTMDNQVSYSTVYLYISEVTKLTPVKEQTTWEKISTGFLESLESVGQGIKNFFIGLIINLPYLVVWAVVIVMAVLIIRLIRKVCKKRKALKQEKKLKKQQEKELQQSKTEDVKEREEK
ncbi:MAG: DUF4349 domain-containing protein [Suilimivivens sp.]